MFDQPPDRPGRVVDEATGTLDCSADCSVGLPVADSPILLRAINGDSSWRGWQGCDRLQEDPAGPALCEIDISGGPRTVTVEFE